MAERAFLPRIALTPEIKAKAAELTANETSEIGKMEALFYYIESEIEHVVADLHRGGLTPHAAVEILRNRYADCKDQAVLLIALLQAVGIPSYPAFTNPMPADELNPKIPSLDFCHVIVYIPRPEKDLWLDTTPGITAFWNLFWPDQGRWALVVDGNGGKLLRTPISEAEHNEGKITYDMSIDKGTLQGTMRIDARGAFGDNLKTYLSALPVHQQREFLRGQVISLSPYFRVQEIALSDLTNPRVPFRTTLRFTCERYWDEALPSLQFSVRLDQALGTFTSWPTLPPPGEREHDHLIPFPFRVVAEAHHAAPAPGFRVTTLPPETRWSSQWFAFESRFERRNDGVNARLMLTCSETRVRADQYKAFYEEVQKLLRTPEPLITYTRARVDAAGEALEEELRTHPDDLTLMLELSKHYLGQGKYTEARDLLEQATAIHGESGEAHHVLGLAYGYLEEYQKAREAFRAARELGYQP